MTGTTTQPDPQIVAWMRDYRRDYPSARASDAVRAYLDHLSTESLAAALNARRRLAPLVSAWSAAKPPATVADIPAGHGAASLFLRSWTLAARTRVQLVYKREDGTLSPQIDPAGPEDAVMALVGHLAATLPTIDTEDTDLTPLFDTPQIHTDADGRHWDDTGREHRAVDMDGEITYQPVDTTEESK